MRIAYVSESLLPSPTANSVHVMCMCEALAAQGHEVTLVASLDGTALTAGLDLYQHYGVAEGFEVVHVQRHLRRGGVYQYAAAAVALIRRRDVHLVLSRCMPASVFAAARGMRVLAESHEPVANAGPVVERLFRFGHRLRGFERLVVISHALKRYYQQRYPISPENIVVAPDAARDAEPPTPALNPGERLQAGYIGSLYEGRGIELLLAVARRCEWAHFHFVGGDDNAVRRWRGQADDLGNVTFHGYVAPAKVAEVRSTCDVLLAPYGEQVRIAGNTSDTSQWMSPLKIFEYMAAARPVICSDLPVLREVLRHGDNALLAAPGDTAAWVRALERLRRDPQLGGRIAAQARSDFENHYTWSRRAERILQSVTTC